MLTGIVPGTCGPAPTPHAETLVLSDAIVSNLPSNVGFNAPRPRPSVGLSCRSNHSPRGLRGWDAPGSHHPHIPPRRYRSPNLPKLLILRTTCDHALPSVTVQPIGGRRGLHTGASHHIWFAPLGPGQWGVRRLGYDERAHRPIRNAHASLMYIDWPWGSDPFLCIRNKAPGRHPSWSLSFAAGH